MLKNFNFNENDRLKLLPEKTDIDPRKLRDYLLNPAHPEGATKAQYLSEMGYNQENYRTPRWAKRQKTSYSIRLDDTKG